MFQLFTCFPSAPESIASLSSLGSELPAVEADPGQVQQVVMNLIINGAEAVGEGQAGTVVVRTGTRDLSAEDIQREFASHRLVPGKYVAIEVRDSGAGMDEATQARIFDPFFTTKFQGRGLGLAATSGIVRRHKGAIRVYSSPGRGTSFHVLLPALATQTPGLALRCVPTVTPTAGAVLFVDDEQSIRMLAKSALERNGWRVLVANNGAEAVQRFEERQDDIALVILDLAMPVMGGEEAWARIKALRTGVPVIISSGYGETEASGRFTGKDIAGFLQKPYTVTQLMEAIAIVLGQL
jgi:CheY-like chemotaxis protein